MSDNNDKKLMDIVDKLNIKSDSEPETELIEEVEKTSFEDIKDMTLTQTPKKILSNTDYLILNAVSSGDGLETISKEYEVTQNHIKKLMRSDSGSEFLATQAKKKADMALAISTTTVAEGVLQYQQMIDSLFKEGKTSLALTYLFGKQSLSEVQASLHKQSQGQEADEKDKLVDLFAGLMVDRKDNG